MPTHCIYPQPCVLHGVFTFAGGVQVYSNNLIVPMSLGVDTVAGGTYSSFANTLGPRCLDFGWAPAILQFAQGGRSVSWFVDNYSTMAASLTAWLGHLSSPRIRGMVWYQGESDVGSTSGFWSSNMETLVTQIRTTVSAPTMPIVIVKLPNYVDFTTQQLADFHAEQDAFVALDARASSVFDAAATQASAQHVDIPSLARLGYMLADRLRAHA